MGFSLRLKDEWFFIRRTTGIGMAGSLSGRRMQVLIIFIK